MSIFTLLIKTRFFKDSIKENPVRLSMYVIDYADYSTLILEQLGCYRYRQLNTCVLGQEEPVKFMQLLTARNDSQTFYCNKRNLHIPKHEIGRAFKRPEEYAIVLYNCYR